MRDTRGAVFFEPERPIFTAQAPGRMDVMGGIADYSGSLVLQMPISEHTTVRLQPTTDGGLRLYSAQAAEADLVADFTADWVQVDDEGMSLHEVGQRIRQLPGGDWAVYVAGCLAVLRRSKGLKVSGMRIWVSSEVPFGKGVSSSAAVEVATMKALQQAYDLRFDHTELPRLAQQVENQVGRRRLWPHGPAGQLFWSKRSALAHHLPA
ncbi:MAG: hypothetical protein HC842_00430 [Cytophagales bacterium]|nr:hypothetical protein [Cytophagales bacterium]